MSLKVNNLIGFGVGGVNVLEYNNHTHTDATNVDPTIPSGVLAGDLLIAMALDGGIANGITTPSGWTSVASNEASGSVRGSIVAKVASGSESGSLSLFTSAVADAGIVLALTGGLTSLGSVIDPDAEATTGNPTAQIKNASTLGTLPFVVVAFYGAIGGVTTRTFTGDTPDAEKGATEAYVKWKYYAAGSSPSDITVDMDDDGGDNFLASAIIEVNF